jgi:hypothetical protein
VRIHSSDCELLEPSPCLFEQIRIWPFQPSKPVRSASLPVSRNGSFLGNNIYDENLLTRSERV